MSYLPCELHCHTLHSDGDFQVKELLEAAKDDHITLIALTDHNTTSGWAELDDSILPAIRGIEWTTYFGHMLVLGADSFVDWRDATPDNIDEKIKQVKACGGLVGVAHPYQIGSPVCTGGRWEFNVKDWRSVDYVEICHEAFSFDNYENDKTIAFWTDLLDKGYRIAATYGRDWHRNENKGHYGITYLDIEGEIDAQNAKRAIRMGKTCVSTGAKFFMRAHQNGRTYNLGETVQEGEAVFSFYCDLYARRKNAGDESVEYTTVKIVTNGGKTLCETDLTTRHVIAELEPHSWYRAELWGTVNSTPKLLAITSPIYTQ